MRPLLFCLVPCYLLSAAPSLPNHSRPPEGPGTVVTDSGEKLPDNVTMERLAREQPTEFLRKCLIRYQRKVKSYRLTMYKHERINGELKSPELMKVAFREEPFSVFLEWTQGGLKAWRVLYVKGENDDMMLVRLTENWERLAKIMKRLKDGLKVVDPTSEEALESGRSTIREFGLDKGLNRLLADWETAEKKNDLRVEYLGEQIVEQAGNRPCFVLRGTHLHEPIRDGVTEQTAYIDKETWLQVGAEARGKPGLLGAYFYRDIEINPKFAPNQFTIAALKE